MLCLRRQFSILRQIYIEEVWQLYSSGKQTCIQLAAQFSCSTKTVQRLPDKAFIIKRKEYSSVAVVIMDTTCFGLGFGVMVFRNSPDGVVLFKQYVRYETSALIFIRDFGNQP
jgi:hypothetical protein